MWGARVVPPEEGRTSFLHSTSFLAQRLAKRVPLCAHGGERLSNTVYLSRRETFSRGAPW